ncbi:MAG: site-specific DNA-methyltransferase [Cenarchaeum sp. SB0661_bin_35]|nr:site-specific DNA-methyltransferase [Cenarchaeum sp. SB0667_bin_13]MYC80352.1 site-specific DNA-methyltransferase [Cenarchaeum sp. SB0661_bin_35]MYD58644.1 site-specific DNA-methyltransferase [Cenarchaeum sp. SB0678_bin_8]MYI52289.1 site-specific DNA-methyltransferase [Cenarchaeum sp. SB0673_bin_9]
MHKYPAKFFPELPRWIIEKYSKRVDWVLDPFAGSGTVNVESMLLGRPSIALDIDPFARFLIKAKTTKANTGRLTNAARVIRERLGQFGKNEPTLPNFPYADHWFAPHILHELARIKHVVQSVRMDTATRNFILVVFSSIIRTVSNADNHCTRTVVRKRLNKPVRGGLTIQLFLAQLDKQIRQMDALPGDVSKVIVPDNADARKIRCRQDVRLAVTSPPYLNAVDYPRTHQLEMYWLGIANGSLRDLKREHIGTEVVYSNEYKIKHLTGDSCADRVIERVFATDPRRAYIAWLYLQDMGHTFEAVYEALVEGSHYVVVVGDNMIRGTPFESWKYFIPMAESVGFTTTLHFESEIINHYIKVPRKKRITSDHILVFQK